MKTTYVRVVVETELRLFPVAGIDSKFTGIGAISWRQKVRNTTQFGGDSVLAVEATNNVLM